jgi:thiamine biosynthesis lipoprotein
MGTLVTVHVVRAEGPEVNAAVDRAFGWFHEIEQRCSRFTQSSELMQLSAKNGTAIHVSSILYEAVQFALMLAEESGGAFDPTVGHKMAGRGFNKEHRTGEIVCTVAADDDVSYRDVQLDPDLRTIRLLRPLTLDLGAVAKGLAVDAAARELEPFKDFVIDAGGDLYMGGLNPEGTPWRVGIHHPRRDYELIDSLMVTNQAICTSGDYERREPNGDGHHILDPRTGGSANAVASATVVASGAMLADALATAAFVLGPEAGIQLLDRMGVEGLIVTPELERYETRGLCHAA